MKLLSLIFILLSAPVFAGVLDTGAPTKTAQDDKDKIAQYTEECELINVLLVRNLFPVSCKSNYQFFGPTSKGSKPSSSLKIAGYNLLHPGTSKALFKDYTLVAKIINQYDVVSGLELLATVGHDRVVNNDIIAFLKSSDSLVLDLKNQINKSQEPKKTAELKNKLAKLNTDIKAAYDIYRAPGYFKVLMQLKKLDPSWSLLLSPRGDSALQGSVEEMVGFFFRASTVSLVTNPHCNEYRGENAGTPYGCLINLTSSFMGKNYLRHFARRPFMASFKAGAMKFTLVSFHTVFGYSGDEEDSKKLMKDVFDVEDPSELGNGINKANFARFAEVKTTLEFINRYKKKYNDNNIMFVADTNLTANNAFWGNVLKSLPGSSLLIDEATTVSPQRYNVEGKETLGVANSYDHFVLDKAVFHNCNNGEVYNYYKSAIQSDIEQIYMIRKDNPASTLVRPSIRTKGLVLPLGDNDPIDVPPEDDQHPTKLDYPLSSSGSAKMESKALQYSKYLRSLLTVKKNEVAADDFQLEERIDAFKRRVFLNQLTNAFYYRFYQEILSDHFPVSITCKL